MLDELRDAFIKAESRPYFAPFLTELESLIKMMAKSFYDNDALRNDCIDVLCQILQAEKTVTQEKKDV